MVTGSVSVTNGLWARLPVKTNRPVPKDQVRAVARVLRQVTTVAPVRLGDVIVANVLDSGADIVATRDMPAA
jgi:CxxC motif-containing protein